MTPRADSFPVSLLSVVSDLDALDQLFEYNLLGRMREALQSQPPAARVSPMVGCGIERSCPSKNDRSSWLERRTSCIAVWRPEPASA
jgi:hypothetical protein